MIQDVQVVILEKRKRIVFNKNKCNQLESNRMSETFNLKLENQYPLLCSVIRDQSQRSHFSLWQWRGFYESCEFLEKLNIRGFFVRGRNLLKAFVGGDSWQTLEAIIQNFAELFL